MPVGIVISIPLTFYGGIGAAARQGVMIKSSHQLELLTKADTFVFDKTGTLTEGVFEVKKIHPEGMTEEELLELTAYIEYFSNHPISMSLQKMYKKGSRETADRGSSGNSGTGDLCSDRWEGGICRKSRTFKGTADCCSKSAGSRYDRVCCTRWSVCGIYCDR